MDKMERELQAQQLNLLNAQLGVLCQLYAANHAYNGLDEVIEKNIEIGRMLSDLTSKIYGEGK